MMEEFTILLIYKIFYNPMLKISNYTSHIRYERI